MCTQRIEDSLFRDSPLQSQAPTKQGACQNTSVVPTCVLWEADTKMALCAQETYWETWPWKMEEEEAGGDKEHLLSSMQVWCLRKERGEEAQTAGQAHGGPPSKWFPTEDSFLGQERTALVCHWALSLAGSSWSAQSCLTLWDPDSSPPDSSVHGVLQGRMLEWVAISFSREQLEGRRKTYPPSEHGTARHRHKNLQVANFQRHRHAFTCPIAWVSSPVWCRLSCVLPPLEGVVLLCTSLDSTVESCSSVPL